MPLQLEQRLYSSHARHANVQQQNLWLLPLHRRDDLVTVVDLPNDLDTSGECKQPAYAFTDQVLIVCQQYTNSHG